MLTQCPACHARAQLPDSRSGAKVRCGECGRAYLAVPAGGRESRRGSRTRTKIIVVVAAAVVGAVALPLLKHGIGWGPPAEAAAGEESRPPGPAPVEAGAPPSSTEPHEPASGLPAPSGG